MNRILIVEDNYFQLEMLKETICDKYPDWTVDTSLNFENGKKLLDNSINLGCYYHLFLFDVKLSNLPEDNGGFELAKETRKYSVYYKTPIIFLSGYTKEYHYALSEIHCYNYMEKPIFPEQLLSELKQMSITGYLECENNDFIELVDTNRIHHKIVINDIYTIEAKNHTLVVRTNNGSIVTREYTLDKILNVLSSNFVQCHRGIIINKKYIDNYDKTCHYIQLRGESIPVGKSYRLQLESVL